MKPRHRGGRRLPTKTLLALAAGGLAIAPVTVPAPAVATIDVPVTYLGHTHPTTVQDPTADKPQSKLWYTDGSWWALMVPTNATTTRIFRLNSSTHVWQDTGTVVDSHLSATGDALWRESEQQLTVVSRDATTNARVTRFSYNSSTDNYTLVSGFPVTVNTGGGSESAAIDQDSTDRLWITYTRGGKVWVAHSDPSGLGWTSGYNPAVGDFSIRKDDISTIVAFNGGIGVMWSDQGSAAFRFAIHQDGAGDQAWSVETPLRGTSMADDHLNVKTYQGRVYAAIKTSEGDHATDPPTAPLVGVLVRTPGQSGDPGSWEFLVTGTVADDHTRPIVMIDQTNQHLYFMATAGSSSDDIFYKRTSLTNPDFSNQPGLGQRFINAKFQLNNATGSKQPVTADTGLVILSASSGQDRYAHGEMDLAGGPG